MVIIDFSGTQRDGKLAENILDQIGISTSKSTIPDDPNPPFRPSGLRLGMQAMTTRGITEDTTRQIVRLIHEALIAHQQPDRLAQLKAEVVALSRRHPLPSL